MMEATMTWPAPVRWAIEGARGQRERYLGARRVAGHEYVVTCDFMARERRGLAMQVRAVRRSGASESNLAAFRSAYLDAVRSAGRAVR